MLEIKDVPIGDIKAYWRNPRLNDQAVLAVKESIQRYGFNSPILLDKEGVIIAGHTRYRAVMELGFEKVPCVEVDLPPDKARAYRIADNKTSEFASWDMNALISELRAVQGAENMQDFFPDFNLEDFLKEASISTPPTTEQINKTADTMNDRFKDQSKATQDGYVEMICPHCAEQFLLARSEIDAAPNAKQ